MTAPRRQRAAKGKACAVVREGTPNRPGAPIDSMGSLADSPIVGSVQERKAKAES